MNGQNTLGVRGQSMTGASNANETSGLEPMPQVQFQGSTLGGTQMGASGTSKVRSEAELRAARENRAQEALRMKEEQLRILNSQNTRLLEQLNTLETQANTTQMEKLAVEEENRTIREQNFELQARVRSADAQLKKVQADAAEKDKQLSIMTDHNSELLRLLESEEAQTARLQADSDALRRDLEGTRAKYGALLSTAKTHEEMAGRAAREGQLRAEEVRLLRAEVEQLKQSGAELRMKTQVELEALQEQLRVRKEKQYQLLEKLQGQEEAKRQAEDQVAGMEEKLRALHAKSVELETQLQVEGRARRNQEEGNRKMAADLENTLQANQDLQSKIQQSEAERLRMEAEARDSSDQLREMAEKVFQLLERLKLAELGKNKAMEALRIKEVELVALKKKNSRLIKESTKEGKARVAAELDKKVLADQCRALKAHNAQLAAHLKEEVKLKLKEHEERKETEEKCRTLGGRLTFLLNKMQGDEEAKVIQKEDEKKMEAQIKGLQAQCEELQRKLDETGQSNRIITQAVRVKQEELEELKIQHNALKKVAAEARQDGGALSGDEGHPEVDEADDLDEVRAREGRGRFYLVSKPTLGLMLMKAKRPEYREWLEEKDANGFLKRAQKSTRFKEMVLDKMCQLYGLLHVEEAEAARARQEVTDKDGTITHLGRKAQLLQDKLGSEEEAKRRTLLRYVHAVKAAASRGIEPANGTRSEEEELTIGTPGKGVLQLPESSLTNEEVHAVAALLRGNMHVVEVNLRGNVITDEGAKALAGVIGGRTNLRSLDLRGNKIGKQGIRALAEALERSERVRHVYVHANGKIEALGTNQYNPEASLGSVADRTAGSAESNPNGPMVTVETVCVVDVREQVADAPSPDLNTSLFGNSLDATLLQQNSGGMGLDSPGVYGQSTITKHLFEPSALLNASSVLGQEVSKEMKRKAQKKKAKEEQYSREELERRAKMKQRQDEMMAKNSVREAGWAGRAGGMDIAPRYGSDGEDEEQNTELQRSSTAPIMTKKKKQGQFKPSQFEEAEQIQEMASSNDSWKWSLPQSLRESPLATEGSSFIKPRKNLKVKLKKLDGQTKSMSTLM